MKKYFILFLLCLLPTALKAEINPNCTYNGIPLYGRVKIVEHFADFRVKAVFFLPDLRVQQVSSFANSCGRWQLVDSFPDFTVQFVDVLPDFTIQFVESFPGIG